MKKIVLQFLLILIPFFLLCQTRISGKLYLDIDKGIIEGKIHMNNFPHDKKLSLILHKGMNIKFVKENNKIIYNEPKELFWDSNINYVFHEFVNNKKELDSLSDIYIEYSGKFPTFHGDEVTSDDDMGVVAIKDGVLRTTFQYPIIPFFKEINGNMLSKQTYDLEVICSKEETVYLNNCDIQKGKNLKFKNDVPTQFLMYAGNYKTLVSGNLRILNSNLHGKEAQILSNEIDKIREYYKQKLGIAYDNSVVLPQIFTIGPKNQYSGWGFTVSPTIVLDYNAIQPKLINGECTDNRFLQTISHEMAHKYFGGIVMVSNDLWPFYHESISQYLSFKYLKQKSKVDYLTLLKENTFKESYKMAKFPNYYEMGTSTVDITNASYNYYYLYLFGFEKEFGEEKTFQLLRNMLKNTKDFTKYGADFFKINALESGLSKEQWEMYNDKYLKSNNCLKEFNTGLKE